VNDGCLPIPNPDIVLSFRVERSAHYGPLVARGTLTDGTPVAVSTLRTTYGNELGSAIGFRRINDPAFMTNGYQSFRQAMGGAVDYTFNWFYLDRHDIGYQHSCKCPQRAEGIDPYLPAWGDGRFDWQGFIPARRAAVGAEPGGGLAELVEQQAGARILANDHNYSYGPVYRSLMLDKGVKPLSLGTDAVRTEMIDAMESAATTDLRGQEDLPELLAVMGRRRPAAPTRARRTCATASPRGRRPARTAATSTTTGPTTIRRRPRSSMHGGLASCARSSTRAPATRSTTSASRSTTRIAATTSARRSRTASTATCRRTCGRSSASR
jgi:hypothetical protein